MPPARKAKRLSSLLYNRSTSAPPRPDPNRYVAWVELPEGWAIATCRCGRQDRLRGEDNEPIWDFKWERGSDTPVEAVCPTCLYRKDRYSTSEG